MLVKCKCVNNSRYESHWETKRRKKKKHRRHNNKVIWWRASSTLRLCLYANHQKILFDLVRHMFASIVHFPVHSCCMGVNWINKLNTIWSVCIFLTMPFNNIHNAFTIPISTVGNHFGLKIDSIILFSFLSRVVFFHVRIDKISIWNVTHHQMWLFFVLESVADIDLTLKLITGVPVKVLHNEVQQLYTHFWRTSSITIRSPNHDQISVSWSKCDVSNTQQWWMRERERKRAPPNS